MTNQPDHWNAPEQLPPVACPLLIRLACGAVLPAERTSHVADRSRELEYRLADGRVITGRYFWSYP